MTKSSSMFFSSIWKFPMQRFSWRTCNVRAAGANLECRRHELLGRSRGKNKIFPQEIFKIRLSKIQFPVFPGPGPSGSNVFLIPIHWPVEALKPTLGSLSNDDAYGNENGKKAIGLISKTTTLHVHHAFFVHFFAVVARLQRESAWIHVLSRTGTQDNNFLFFSWTLIKSFRIQLQKHLPTFDEVNEME